MKISKWKIGTAVTFILLSAIFYILHYQIFRDMHHIFLYLIGDIAFVFIQVLLVTLILEQLLEKREKKSRMEKLNMVIGVFFSEMGTELLRDFANQDPNIEQIRNELIINKEWTQKDFNKAKNKIKQYNFTLTTAANELSNLYQKLHEKSEFLLQILENPTLLEHESFTDLLQASFHLSEELKHRPGFSSLPETDIKHLQLDCVRVYSFLMLEWLNYMQYLVINYPYLFSLGMRTNPFDKCCSVIVAE